MVCAKLLIFSFGDCANTQTQESNTSITAFSESVKNIVQSTSNSAEPTQLSVLDQNVTINGYTGLVDIKITQDLSLNIASSAEINNELSATAIASFKSDLTTKINSTFIVEGDVGGDPSYQKTVDNVKEQILNKFNSEAFQNAVNKASPVTISSLNQNVTINFADMNKDTLEALLVKYKTTDGGKTVISISQSLVNDIQSQAKIDAVLNVFLKDEALNKAIVDMCKKLSSKSLGLAGVASQTIKEIGQTAREAVGAIKWGLIALIIGAVVIFVALAWVLKSFLSNPDAIKAVGSSVSQVKGGGMGGGFKFSSKHYY
jgi:hypothetical protein